MSDNHLSALAVVFLVSTFCAAPAVASDDQRWGVKDPADAQALVRELNEILDQPADAAQGKTGRAPTPGERVLLDHDPELREAYRADPGRTLSLIARIRAAAGEDPS